MQHIVYPGCCASTDYEVSEDAGVNACNEMCFLRGFRARMRALIQERHSHMALNRYLPEHEPAETAYQTDLRRRM